MLLRRIINLLLPDQCLVCRTTLHKDEKSLCLVCQSKLPRVRGEKADNEAEHRMFGRVPFEHGTSFCYYRQKSDFSLLIVGAKYADRPWVNYNMASLFATELSCAGWPFDIDVIVPVPIHLLRKIERGYNQTVPIAKALSKAWGLPIEYDCLVKGRHTKSQVKQQAHERMRIVENVFLLKHPERIEGKHVLVVDDVLTTGATLDACLQLLVDAGARVSFLTLGLAD